MLKQNYVLLIMNCEKYKKKALYQKHTWLNSIPDYIKYYHVIGDESLVSPFRFDHDNNILFVKVCDDYVSLPKKVIAAYAAIFLTYDYDYIFKTDDDQILLRDNFFDILKNILETKTPKPHYGGYIVDVKHNYLSEYHTIHPELPKHLPILQTKYCSGRFYFLSKKAVGNLLFKREKIEQEYLEDYAIGYNLDPIYKKDMITLLTTKIFKDIEPGEFNIFLDRFIEENKI